MIDKQRRIWLDAARLIWVYIFIPAYLSQYLVVLGSIVYNRVIVYMTPNFFKVVVHVIIFDQCNQTVR